MTVLDAQKPIERIHFDPNEKTHRVALKTFLTSNRWIMHFKSDDTHNLPYRMMVQTLLWYTDKE